MARVVEGARVVHLPDPPFRRGQAAGRQRAVRRVGAHRQLHRVAALGLRRGLQVQREALLPQADHPPHAVRAVRVLHVHKARLLQAPDVPGHGPGRQAQLLRQLPRREAPLLREQPQRLHARRAVQRAAQRQQVRKAKLLHFFSPFLDFPPPLWYHALRF